MTRTASDNPAPPGPDWHLADHLRTPQTFATPAETTGDRVEPVFFEGPPWHGRATRVFACLGLPAAASSASPVPGLVLVHGGGGTAFGEWVRMWADRGYAAIAPDCCGCVPVPPPEKRRRHGHPGPVGWGGLEQIDDRPRDQWPYHATAAAIRAASWLAARPEVDATRIGMTGISWGGFLTCLAAGLDKRLKLAMPVYGCGFLGENSAWRARLAEMSSEQRRRWLGLWDPSHYLPRAGIPFLWVTGTNDKHFPMDSYRKSYRLTGQRTLCIRPDMKHSHGDGWAPLEPFAFADSVLRDGPKLPRLSPPEVHGRTVRLHFAADTAVDRAEMVWTADRGPWPERAWRTTPAKLDPIGHAEAAIPAEASACYLNLIDSRGLVSSSEYVQI